MKALILVDIQNDFVPGGSLAVADGDSVVSIANKLIDQFQLVVATQDWHPDDHLSFASQHPPRSVGEVIDLEGLDQVLWPDHCVQGTHGAEFVEQLNVDSFDRVFQKGTHRNIDSYSGFFDNGKRSSTGMGDFLKEREVQDVYVLGLATDYCVKFTAIDAAQLGFKTHLILEGCRGVELKEGDISDAIAKMQDAGVVIHETFSI